MKINVYETKNGELKHLSLKVIKLIQLITEFIPFVEPEVSSPFYHQLRFQSARRCPRFHKIMRFCELKVFLRLVLCLILRRKLSVASVFELGKGKMQISSSSLSLLDMY